MRIFIILLSYSLVLSCSELLYRIVFKIPSLDLKNFFENIIFIFLLQSIFYFSKYKVTKLISLTLFAISILANNIHYEIYKSWITGLNYYLAFKEFGEVALASQGLFSQLYPHIIWGILDCIIFLSIIKLKQNTKQNILSDILLLALLIFSYVKGVTAPQEAVVSPKVSYGRVKEHFLALGHLWGKIIPNEVLGISSVKNYFYPKPNKVALPKFKNIILIMGESASSKHMSIFGYNRNTTPFLKKISSDNVVIKEGISAGVLTILSLPPFFNAVPYPNGHHQMNSGDTNLFRLAKEQGYKTYFYSAQAENQMGMMNLLGKRWIDDLKFPTDLGLFPANNMPDDKLLPLFHKIDLNKGNNLIVLHQRASHMPYGELLEDKDFIFGNENLLDKYDSTIYKTDLFIQNVFEYLYKQNSNDWLLIYTSDHGQYVTKDINNQGTSDPDNYNIPVFLHTTNNQLQSEIRDIFSKCEKATHQQLITYILSSLGYDIPISNCYKSYINTDTLSGDLGYLEIIQPNQIKRISMENK